MSSSKTILRTFALSILGIACAPLAGAQGCNPQAFPHPLLPPGAGSGADFGSSVAVRGDYAIVGAPNAKSGAGAVYFYRLENGDWVKDAEVTASGGSSTSDAFGTAVAMDDERAYVGAPGAAGNAQSDGKVYVYKRTIVLGYELWLLESKLFAADGVNGEQFGAAVAADDGVLLVGQPRNSIVNELNIGAVLTYELVGGLWAQKAKLLATSPLQWEQFGASLALDGAYAVIGSPTHGGPLPYPTANGRAWIFRRQSASSWSLDKLLNPTDYIANRNFGASVAIVGTRVLVGAPGAEAAGGYPSGAGYVFEKPFGAPTWSLTSKLASGAIGFSPEYGTGVALTLNQAWLGGLDKVLRFEFDSGAWASKGNLEVPFADLDSSYPALPVGPALAASGPTVFCGQPGVGVSDPEGVNVFHACGGKWTVLGSGTQGISGKPRLRGAGTLQDGLVTEVRLAGGKGSAPALFLLHGGPAGPAIPFAGGMIYALPANLSVPFVLASDGTVVLPGLVPAGLANVKFVAQVLIGDGFASHDIALSNGLEIEIGF